MTLYSWHPYRILIIGGSGSIKTNVLLNLIKDQQPNIDKIYLQVKDPFKLNYQLFIDRRRRVEIKKWKNPKAFTDYSQTIKIIKKIESYSHWFVLKRRKLNIFLAFISQSYFKVPKTIRLNWTNCFIVKIPNKREIQQIASNHLSDIKLKDWSFTKIILKIHFFFSEWYNFILR